MRTTKYNNGNSIPHVTKNDDWGELSTHAYCWYDNDIHYKNLYGALYNWHTVNTDKLCPTGWHVPTDAEWTTLTDYLGGESIAGGKLMETDTIHWSSPNTGATNETGFTALPGGYRYFNGSFFYNGKEGYWWTSSENLTSSSWDRELYYGFSYIGRYSDDKRYGYSVRCLQD